MWVSKNGRVKPDLSNYYNAEGGGIAVTQLPTKLSPTLEEKSPGQKVCTFCVHSKKKPRLWGGALVFNSLRMKVVGRAGFEPA
jgi:hypothetical protein